MATQRSRIGEAYLQIVPVIGNLGQQLGAQIAASIGSSQVSQAANQAGNQVGQQVGQQGGQAAADGMGTKILAGLAALGIANVLADQISAGFEMQGADNKITAALNLNNEESKKAIEATKTLYSQGYGETYETLSETMQQIVGSVSGAREATSDDLVQMGKDVENLAATYGLDGGMITQAVQSMIGSGFAKDWDEAVSIILGGYQTMGSSGEDWIESLNEFSDDFKNLGITGPQSINLINAAIKAGIKDTDGFVDGLNEVAIKISDGTADEGLIGLGLDPAKVKENLKAGGEVANKQFEEIVTNLQAKNDRGLWAAVFGTKAEDYALAFQNLDFATWNEPLKEGIGDMQKFNDTLNQGAASSMKAFGNTIQLVFQELLAPALEYVTPLLGKFVTFLQENEKAGLALVGLIGVALVGSLVLATAAAWAFVAPVLANPITWMIVGAIAAIALVVGSIWYLTANWESGVAAWSELWGGFVGWISGVWGGFVNWISTTVSDVGTAFVDLGKNVGNFFINLVNAWIFGLNYVITKLNEVSAAAPEWLGGGEGGGFGISQVGYIPNLAKGATILPTKDGTTVNVAEAGVPESVVDTGGLNTLIDLTNDKLANAQGGGVAINVYQQPGQSPRELAYEIRDILEFDGTRG